MNKQRKRNQKKYWKNFRKISFSVLFLISACDLAPHYEPTHFILPDDWQGTPPFKIAQPTDHISRGKWWSIFNDPILDQLEIQLGQSNPDLQSAAETYIQSRAILGEVQSQLFPQLNLEAGGGRYKASHKRLWRGKNSNSLIEENNTQYQASVLWEADLWRKIRNQIKMQKQLAQASAADYESAKLSLEADLARNYMLLRGYDAQNTILNESVQYYQAAVDITRMRQIGAIAGGMDVSRAENQLAMTQAQQTEIQAQRAVVEHVIAVMVNRVPEGFHIAPIKTNLNSYSPNIPIGLPSSLLQRRPDIAGAERQMAAANRAIGVSRAAFYPDITINAASGFEDSGFGLANMANSMWSAAIQGTLPIFQGGARRAALQKSWSVYRQTRDQYRSIVLNAFREVEDGLTLTQLLSKKIRQNHVAVEAALRTQSMAMSLYTGGLTNYLDVVVAQNTALTAQIAEVQSKVRQLQSSVDLIKALGGGWHASEMPQNQLAPFKPLQYNNLRYPNGIKNSVTIEKPQDNDLTGQKRRIKTDFKD